MRIGIDLGGTKTEIIALAKDGATLLRRRVTSPQGDYTATVACIAGLVKMAESELGQSGSVGVGIPGAESLATGCIKNANSAWLIGRPLRSDLEQALAREIRLANDANCFALSEAADGAAAGARVVFGAILGTGVGGGIVVNGQVLEGANSIAGEWGHCYLPVIPFVPQNQPAFRDATGAFDGPPCYCGRRGCVETYLSGTGLANDHQRTAGEALSGVEIAACAAAGDAACEASLQRYEARLAFALSQIINLLDPEVIVLGGGVSNLERLYVNVPRLWGAHVFSDEPVRTRLLRHRHGDSSGVRGAAWLWPVGAD